MGSEPPIRWDIVEEHLDQAAFLYQLWEQSLRSPRYSLQEIAEGPEGRMLAHLDGLVIGGSRVARKLLIPALDSDEGGIVFAAAFALLASEDGDFLAPVLEALTRVEPEPKATLLRAMEVVPGAQWGGRWVALAAERGPLRRDLLLVLAYRGVDPGVSLDELAAPGDVAARRRVLALAPRLPGRLGIGRVEEALSSQDGQVRGAALEAGFLLGARAAPAAALDALKQLGPGFDAAAVLLAMSGDESVVSLLASALANPDRASQAAFALGFSGRASAVEPLLAALDQEKLAPVAGEAISAITGLPIAGELVRQRSPWSLDSSDEEEEEKPPFGPEADLPAPDPAEVRRWWRAQGERVNRQARLLRGRPSGTDHLLRELESGPARRRRWLAAELGLRTRRPHVVTTDALTARQAEELAAARGLAGAGQARGVS